MMRAARRARDDRLAVFEGRPPLGWPPFRVGSLPDQCGRGGSGMMCLMRFTRGTLPAGTREGRISAPSRSVWSDPRLMDFTPEEVHDMSRRMKNLRAMSIAFAAVFVGALVWLVVDIAQQAQLSGAPLFLSLGCAGAAVTLWERSHPAYSMTFRRARTRTFVAHDEVPPE